MAGGPRISHFLLPYESRPHPFWVAIANQGTEHPILSCQSRTCSHSSCPKCQDLRHAAEMTGNREKVNTTSVSTKFKSVDNQPKEKNGMQRGTELLSSPNLSLASAVRQSDNHQPRGTPQIPHSHSLQFQGRKKLNSYLS